MSRKKPSINEALIVRYLTHLKEQERTEATLRKYGHDLRAFCTFPLYQYVQLFALSCRKNPPGKNRETFSRKTAVSGRFCSEKQKAPPRSLTGSRKTWNGAYPYRYAPFLVPGYTPLALPLGELSLSKNYPNAPVSAIIRETGVYSWKSGEKMHGTSQL